MLLQYTKSSSMVKNQSSKSFLLWKNVILVFESNISCSLSRDAKISDDYLRKDKGA